MRIILYTGKGGVGKTSVAASTAVKSAKNGLRTLVVSTDPAHSLGDSLDTKLGPEPVKILDNLWAQEIDSIHEIEKGWGQIQKYLTTLFTSKAVKDISIEELTIFPGMEDLLSLLRILQYYKSNEYDVIIIDCAPTGETLALLSYPEMLDWWINKLFPIQRRVLKVMRPVAEPLIGVPLPTDQVMNELLNVLNQLDEMRQILSDREISSIRIVVNPEKMVIKEAQRSFTYLNIYDYNVDAIVVNRVIPQHVTDDYFKAWIDIQKKYMETIKESFEPIPIYQAPLYEQEVVGLTMLERMGNEVFGSEEPTDIKFNARTQQITKQESGYIFTISMPFARKEDLQLSQKADELIVKAGNVKRTFTLPRVLSQLTIQGAKFEDETLQIRFGS